MSKEKLKKAREFEQEQLKRISPEERPCYHVTGGSGWINDPNGFSFYKDEYHLFYQYHPYSNEWGPMHWGHVTSKDLITWERLPLAMVPEESYDNFGCFSGSGVELPDGRHLLMYTGVGYVSDIPMANGELPTHQTQCLEQITRNMKRIRLLPEMIFPQAEAKLISVILRSGRKMTDSIMQ